MTLTYRDKGTSGTQIEVRHGRLRVAHISKEMFSGLAGGGTRWRWYFAIGNGPEGFQANGTADTLDDAKANVERNWRMWLDAAGLKE